MDSRNQLKIPDAIKSVDKFGDSAKGSGAKSGE